MKFVIHHHITKDEHYDFMFEDNNILVTFSVKAADLAGFLAGGKTPAKKIQDHRKEYLTYEGPISCDRGRIKLFDSGAYAIKSVDAGSCHYILQGAKIKGTVTITAKKNNCYELQYIFNNK